MRVLRASFVALVLSVFAIGAFADSVPDIRIIFDPSVGAVATPIYTLGTPVVVSWQSCSNTGIPLDLSKETACLVMNNLTGGPLTSLTMSFAVPSSSPLIGQIVDCEYTPGNILIDNNCPPGTLTAGQLVDITFFGGDPVPNGEDIFIGADAAGLTGPSDFPPVTITGSVPEPATLILIPTGLLILGLGWTWRRRHHAVI